VGELIWQQLDLKHQINERGLYRQRTTILEHSIAMPFYKKRNVTSAFALSGVFFVSAKTCSRSHTVGRRPHDERICHSIFIFRIL